MNGFQPVRFPLAIVPVDDVDPVSPMDFAGQISEVVCPDGSKEHN